MTRRIIALLAQLEPPAAPDVNTCFNEWARHYDAAQADPTPENLAREQQSYHALLRAERAA